MTPYCIKNWSKRYTKSKLYSLVPTRVPSNLQYLQLKSLSRLIGKTISFKPKNARLLCISPPLLPTKSDRKYLREACTIHDRLHFTKQFRINYGHCPLLVAASTREWRSCDAFKIHHRPETNIRLATPRQQTKCYGRRGGTKSSLNKSGPT